jgi:hypothetical protein
MSSRYIISSSSLSGEMSNPSKFLPSKRGSRKRSPLLELSSGPKTTPCEPST